MSAHAPLNQSGNKESKHKSADKNQVSSPQVSTLPKKDLSGVETYIALTATYGK